MTGNIKKAQRSWGHLARVLGMEGSDPKVSQTFYTVVTHQVLLFRAETWVMTKNMESALDTFQGRVARTLTGRQPRRGRDEWWFPGGGDKGGGDCADSDIDPPEV